MNNQLPVEQRIENFMARKMEQFPELKRKRVSEAEVIRRREKFFSSILDLFAPKHVIVNAK